MNNFLKVMFWVSVMSNSFKSTELSAFTSCKERALRQHEAQEICLSESDKKDLKNAMMAHSRGYVQEVWSDKQELNDASAQDFDVIAMRTKDGYVKALLVSGKIGYSFIHEVPCDIAQNLRLNE